MNNVNLLLNQIYNNVSLPALFSNFVGLQNHQTIRYMERRCYLSFRREGP
jgi:hypothetical protein